MNIFDFSPVSNHQSIFQHALAINEPSNYLALNSHHRALPLEPIKLSNKKTTNITVLTVTDMLRLLQMWGILKQNVRDIFGMIKGEERQENSNETINHL